jgi:hypothetical protein
VPLAVCVMLYRVRRARCRLRALCRGIGSPRLDFYCSLAHVPRAALVPLLPLSTCLAGCVCQRARLGQSPPPHGSTSCTRLAHQATLSTAPLNRAVLPKT